MQEYGENGRYDDVTVRFDQVGAVAHVDSKMNNITIDLLDNGTYNITLIGKGDGVEVEKRFNSYSGSNRSIVISLDFVDDNYDEVWLEIRNGFDVAERHRIIDLG